MAGHHRLRLADGRHVHRAAVPAERARLLDGRRRGCHLAGGDLHGAGRAAFGQDRGRAGRTLHAARSAMCSCWLGFLTMLLLWNEGIPYWMVALGYAFVGIGVGLAGTPASRSLTGSVPVTRAGHGLRHGGPAARPGRRHHAVDLRGAAGAGYAAAMAAAIARSPESAQMTASITNQLEMSYASAETIAQQYPQYATQITPAAKTSFLAGDQYAYMAGIIAVLLGAVLVFFMFPKLEEERKLLVEYHAQDMAGAAKPGAEMKEVAAPKKNNARTDGSILRFQRKRSRGGGLQPLWSVTK